MDVKQRKTRSTTAREAYNAKVEKEQAAKSTPSPTDKSDQKQSTSTAHDSKDGSNAKPPGKSTEPQAQGLFPKHRVWSRIVLVLGVLIVVYFTNSKTKESIFGDFKEDLSRGKGFDIKCTFKYTDALKNYPEVIPTSCGRVIVDQLLPTCDPFLHVIKQIINKHFRNQPPPFVVIDIGKWTLNSYKSVGGPSELIDLNSIIPVTKDFTDNFRLLHRRLKQVIKEHYKIPGEKIHLADPSFITILNGRDSSVDYSSQYTIDQELNNGSFHYSGKVFMNDYAKAETGGRFIFSDKDNIHRIVLPKKGRALAYTSGPENIYFLDPPTKGPLIVLTIGFTANPKQALRNRNLLE